MNHRMYTRQKTIPSLLALIVLIIFVFSLIFIFSFYKKSDQKYTLPKIDKSYIANIRDNTVTVFWTTTKASTGYILYGSSKEDLKSKAYDERDKSENPLKRKNHFVILRNLKPDSQYYYRFIVDDIPVGQNTNTPFSLLTTRQIKSPYETSPIKGKIISTTSKPVENALVIFQIDKTYPLITLSKIDGSYLIYPCCIFSDSSYEPFYPSGNERAILEVIDESGNSSYIESTFKSFQDHSEPIILDNKKSSFLTNKENSLNTPQDAVSDFLLSSDKVQKYNSVDVVYPKENAYIPANKPLIKGIGFPGKKVKGEIKPDGKIFTIDIKDDGIWNFLPQFELLPGLHTLEIFTQDNTGKTISLKRDFIILKDGESVLGEATQSGQLTPTISPELSATPTPEEPTIFIEPTIIPSPTREPPISGSSIAPFIFLGFALVIIGSGIVLLF